MAGFSAYRGCPRLIDFRVACGGGSTHGIWCSVAVGMGVAANRTVGPVAFIRAYVRCYSSHWIWRTRGVSKPVIAFGDDVIVGHVLFSVETGHNGYAIPLDVGGFVVMGSVTSIFDGQCAQCRICCVDYLLY